VAVRAFYLAAAGWLGLFYFLLLASILLWILSGVSQIFGEQLPAVAGAVLFTAALAFDVYAHRQCQYCTRVPYRCSPAQRGSILETPNSGLGERYALGRCVECGYLQENIKTGFDLTSRLGQPGPDERELGSHILRSRFESRRPRLTANG
jgi:hypothetical protein